MDFAALFDGNGRPGLISAATFHAFGGRAYMPDSWAMLDRAAPTSPVAADRMPQAVITEDDGLPGERPMTAAFDAEETEQSVEPSDIADELCVADCASVEELSSLRRRFALKNHPDRMAPDRRPRATLRMTIANAMIDKAMFDKAAARFHN